MTEPTTSAPIGASSRIAPRGSAGLSKGRIEALSDGIFATILVFLVLDIKVPPAPANGLAYRLFELWPRLLSYALSFIVLGILWIGHHNQFHFVRRTDRGLLWINLAFLMVVALIPFSASYLGSAPLDPVALRIYGMNLIVAGLVLQAHWMYATQGTLCDALGIGIVRMATRRTLLPPFFYAIAIGMTFVDPRLSLAVFFVVPIFYLLPSAIDRQFWR